MEFHPVKNCHCVEFIVANSQEQHKVRGVFHTPHVTLSHYER